MKLGILGNNIEVQFKLIIWGYKRGNSIKSVKIRAKANCCINTTRLINTTVIAKSN